jgi:hypothetical protein
MNMTWINSNKTRRLPAARFRVMVFYRDCNTGNYTVRKLGRAYANLNTAKENLAKQRYDGYITEVDHPHPVVRKMNGKLTNNLEA